MRRALAVLLLATAVAGGVLGEEVPVQQVTPLDNGREQEVVMLNPGGDQQVQGFEPVGSQAVGPNHPPTGAAKAANTAGKVALGVTAAVVSLGVAAASLLFL